MTLNYLGQKFIEIPFKFEKLIVWQRAVDLSDFVHHVTKGFPKDEIYMLTSQIKRAADSGSVGRLGLVAVFRVPSADNVS